MGGVLVSECGCGDVVLARSAQMRTLASARKCVPFVDALTVRPAWIRFALRHSMAPGGNIHETLIGVHLLRENPLIVDDHVLHATDETRWGVRQVTQIRFQMRNRATQIRDRERGVAGVCVVLQNRINGRLFVRRKQQMRRIDGHKHLVPFTIVQAGSNENALLQISRKAKCKIELLRGMACNTYPFIQ